MASLQQPDPLIPDAHPLRRHGVALQGLLRRREQRFHLRIHRARRRLVRGGPGRRTGGATAAVGMLTTCHVSELLPGGL